MAIEKLAEITAKKPWWGVFLWLLLTAVSGFLIVNYLDSALTTKQSLSVETESAKAEELLMARLGTEEEFSELVIIKSDRYKVSDQAFADFTLKVQGELQALGKEVVSSTISFYQTQNPALVSQNQNAVLVIANLPGDLSRAQTNVEKVREVIAANDKEEDFALYQSGTASINQDFQDLAEKDLQKAEFIGIPIALVVLILVFGAVAAALLPVILSFLAIGLAMAASALLGQVYDLSFFVTNMITMMGLAVGIDYSLFIVSRFREERQKGLEKIAAIKKSASTASRAVFFSGITVVIALAGLLLVPSNIFRSLAIGAIFVVVAAVFAALTLLPALLSILGDKVNFLSLPFFGRQTLNETTRGFWHWVAAFVMRLPILSLELSAGVLILASIPLLAINIGSSGVDSLPEELPAKQAFVILENEFSSGLISPTQVVIDGKVDDAKVGSLIMEFEEAIKSEEFVVGASTQKYPDKNLAVINVVLDSSGEETEKALSQIHSESSFGELLDSGAQVLVAGTEARNLDFTKIINDYTPAVFAFVLSLSFVILMLVFRSLIVPVKALIMNLLSVGASYGLLVLVFQKGVGREFFGFQASDQIEAWIPLFLFAILFGLSMDYHVFLLSRIREKFTQTANNTESVAFGLATTGRLITGAALIMVAVFAGFASGSLVMFQQVGFGLAVAILFDATIVRSVLVPASMKLLGNLNWYWPKWLAWLPRVGIEG
jgi:RND superfamily putative drug exporter